MPWEQRLKLIDRCDLCSCLFSPLLTPYVYFMCRLLYSTVTSVHLCVPSFIMAASATPSIESVVWLWPSVLTVMLCSFLAFLNISLLHVADAASCLLRLCFYTSCSCTEPLQSSSLPFCFSCGWKMMHIPDPNKWGFACMTPVIFRMTYHSNKIKVPVQQSKFCSVWLWSGAKYWLFLQARIQDSACESQKEGTCDQIWSLK